MAELSAGDGGVSAFRLVARTLTAQVPPDLVAAATSSMLNSAITLFKASHVTVAYDLVSVFTQACRWRRSSDVDRTVIKGARLLMEASLMLKNPVDAALQLAALVDCMPEGPTRPTLVDDWLAFSAKHVDVTWLDRPTSVMTGTHAAALQRLITAEAAALAGFAVPIDNADVDVLCALTSDSKHVSARTATLSMCAHIASNQSVDAEAIASLDNVAPTLDPALQSLVQLALSRATHGQARPEAALLHARQALAAAKVLGTAGTARMQACLTWLIRLCTAHGDCDAARYYGKRAVQLATDRQQPLALAHAHMRVAELELRRRNDSDYEEHRICALDSMQHAKSDSLAAMCVRVELDGLTAQYHASKGAQEATAEAWSQYIAVNDTFTSAVKQRHTNACMQTWLSARTWAEMERLFAQHQLGVDVAVADMHRLVTTPVLATHRALIALRHAQMCGAALFQMPAPTAASATLSIVADNPDEQCSAVGSYDTMKVAELKAVLKQHGLSTEGKKDVLVKRLQSFTSTAARDSSAPPGLNTARSKEDGNKKKFKAQEPDHGRAAAVPNAHQQLQLVFGQMDSFGSIDVTRKLAQQLQHGSAITRETGSSVFAHAGAGLAARLQAGWTLYNERRCVVIFITASFLLLHHHNGTCIAEHRHKDESIAGSMTWSGSTCLPVQSQAASAQSTLTHCPRATQWSRSHSMRQRRTCTSHGTPGLHQALWSPSSCLQPARRTILHTQSGNQPCSHS